MPILSCARYDDLVAQINGMLLFGALMFTCAIALPLAFELEELPAIDRSYEHGWSRPTPAFAARHRYVPRSCTVLISSSGPHPDHRHQAQRRHCCIPALRECSGPGAFPNCLGVCTPWAPGGAYGCTVKEGEAYKYYYDRPYSQVVADRAFSAVYLSGKPLRRHSLSALHWPRRALSTLCAVLKRPG